MKTGVVVMDERKQSSSLEIVQRKREELAQGYPKWFRFLECVGLILFFIFAGVLGWRIFL